MQHLFFWKSKLSKFRQTKRKSPDGVHNRDIIPLKYSRCSMNSESGISMGNQAASFRIGTSLSNWLRVLAVCCCCDTCFFFGNRITLSDVIIQPSLPIL